MFLIIKINKNYIYNKYKNVIFLYIIFINRLIKFNYNFDYYA